MRLIELRRIWEEEAMEAMALAGGGDLCGADRAHGRVLDIERRIDARLAEGSIGWSEPLKFGISDAERAYEVRR